MNTRELKELRTTPIEKLEAQVIALRDEVVTKKMPKLGDTVRDLKAIRNLRRDIAQILTIITERKKTI